jgi:hypothetical protein
MPNAFPVPSRIDSQLPTESINMPLHPLDIDSAAPFRAAGNECDDCPQALLCLHELHRLDFLMGFHISLQKVDSESAQTIDFGFVFFAEFLLDLEPDVSIRDDWGRGISRDGGGLADGREKMCGRRVTRRGSGLSQALLKKKPTVDRRERIKSPQSAVHLDGSL